MKRIRAKTRVFGFNTYCVDGLVFIFCHYSLYYLAWIEKMMRITNRAQILSTISSHQARAASVWFVYLLEGIPQLLIFL